MLLFPEKEKPNCHSDIWHCHFNREDKGNCFNFALISAKEGYYFNFQ